MDRTGDDTTAGMRSRDKMKNALFWDVTPCGSGKNRLLGGTRNNVSRN
jgi:hypothetical protein